MAFPDWTLFLTSSGEILSMSLIVDLPSHDFKCMMLSGNIFLLLHKVYIIREGVSMFPRNIKVSRSFSSPCSDIWQLITDTHTWPQWGPSVIAVECTDRFISQGTEGRVRTAAGIWLPFLITEYDEGHFWSWKVAGIPATGHRVETQEDGLCQVTFEVPLLAAPYTFICNIALDRIARILE